MRVQTIHYAIKAGMIAYLLLVFAAGSVGYLSVERAILNMLVVIGGVVIAAAGE